MKRVTPTINLVANFTVSTCTKSENVCMYYIPYSTKSILVLIIGITENIIVPEVWYCLYMYQWTSMGMGGYHVLADRVGRDTSAYVPSTRGSECWGTRTSSWYRQPCVACCRRAGHRRKKSSWVTVTLLESM